MFDATRLYAEAEEAQIRGEMARSQSLVAKAKFRKQAIRWSNAQIRLLNASRRAGAIRLTGRADQPD